MKAVVIVVLDKHINRLRVKPYHRLSRMLYDGNEVMKKLFCDITLMSDKDKK